MEVRGIIKGLRFLKSYLYPLYERISKIAKTGCTRFLYSYIFSRSTPCQLWLDLVRVQLYRYPLPCGKSLVFTILRWNGIYCFCTYPKAVPTSVPRYCCYIRENRLLEALTLVFCILLTRCS